MVNLIAGATTASGLTVHAERDSGYYPRRVKITKAELADVALSGCSFHPEWNYTVGPGQRIPSP